MLIVIEGLDGSGKVIQAEYLARKLQQDGKNVKKIHFPEYENQRNALVEMYRTSCYTEKARADKSNTVSDSYAIDENAFSKRWEGDYNTGIVIADCYTTSYAIHLYTKLSEEQWASFSDWLDDYIYEKLRFPKPDIVFFLHADQKVLQKQQAEFYHRNIADGKMIDDGYTEYQKLSRKAADYCAERYKWKIIECIIDGQMLSIDEIHHKIISCIGEVLYGVDKIIIK